MRNLLPDIEYHHKWQEIGMKWEDLVDRHWREIWVHAPETPLNYITQVEDTCFQVCSSNKKRFYEVDLLNEKCTCYDFPHIKFCKHITSVQHHFRWIEHLAPAPAPWLSPIIPVLHINSGNATQDENAAVSLISITDKIIALSQQLLMEMPNTEAASNVVKSLCLVRSHLAVVVVSVTSDGPQLPESEQIAPNQHSWTEMAKQMGVK